MFNIFAMPDGRDEEEVFETLLLRADLKIERIVSWGQVSPEGFWYDQEKHEWVVLLQGKAELRWEDGRRQHLTAGDCLLLRAHEKHRVEYTSEQPHCIWLAVHFE
ncbi:MAG: cupin domain-containing protein [Syntrophomonadaceae bacterium]|nr:cupin domain-containing protein [Syntrophomonadaceae bacterium]